MHASEARSLLGMEDTSVVASAESLFKRVRAETAGKRARTTAPGTQ